MSKIMLMPSNKEEIIRCMNQVDAFIIGIKDLSINLPTYFNLEETTELISIINSNKKQVFISLNKNIHNKDLDYLAEVLIKLNNLDIAGIVYYDIAIVNLKKKLNLKHDLVWSQEHLTTNYATINFWKEFDVSYTMLSSEITLEEILEIKENTTLKLIVPIFGYLPMFTSIRPLVSNYLKYFNIKDKSEINYMYKEEKTYPIKTDNSGTTIYSSQILNGIEESVVLKEKNIDYLLINTFNIRTEKLDTVIKGFKEINNSNQKILSEQINNLFEGLYDKGFLYKETVYKVKNNE